MSIDLSKIPEEATVPVVTTYQHRFFVPEERMVEMAVLEGHQGKHRNRCLCYLCKKFHPGDRDKNCPIANLIFSVCVQANVVLPVAECQAGVFVPAEEVPYKRNRLGPGR